MPFLEALELVKRPFRFLEILEVLHSILENIVSTVYHVTVNWNLLGLYQKEPFIVRLFEDRMVDNDNFAIARYTSWDRYVIEMKLFFNQYLRDH